MKAAANVNGKDGSPHRANLHGIMRNFEIRQSLSAKEREGNLSEREKLEEASIANAWERCF